MSGLNLSTNISVVFVITVIGLLINQNFVQSLLMYALILGEKRALFGEWLRPNMNIKVPLHVKDGGLKKKGGFTFREGSSLDKKRVDLQISSKGKENSGISFGRVKVAGENSQEQYAKSGKRPRKCLEDIIFLNTFLEGADQAISEDAY